MVNIKKIQISFLLQPAQCHIYISIYIQPKRMYIYIFIKMLHNERNKIQRKQQQQSYMRNSEMYAFIVYQYIFEMRTTK